MTSERELKMTPEMPTWEEWSSLSDDQRMYAQFRAMVRGEERMENIERTLNTRIVVCQGSFEQIEAQFKMKKWGDRASNLMGGVIGGAVIILGYIFLYASKISDALDKLGGQ